MFLRRHIDCIAADVDQVAIHLLFGLFSGERPRLDDDGMPVVENEIVIKDEECLWVSADVLDSYIAEGYIIKDNISS